MADLNSADILGIDWAMRARELLKGARKSTGKKEDPLPRYERVDPMAHREPIVIKERNAITDPSSWLNRGLENLAGNAVDAIFGRESGNPVVDYGASNIPGVGAASILAAGGVPGLVDITGVGALKNAKKLMKPVREFILRNAGEEGLQAVDNYLTKFPKVDKLSFADANELLTSGKLGQRFDVQFDTRKLAEIAENGFNANIDKLIAMGGNKLLQSDIDALRGLQNAFSSAIEKGDIADAANISSSYWTAMSSEFGGMHAVHPGDIAKMSDNKEFENLRRQHAKRMANPEHPYLSTSQVPGIWAAQKDEIIDDSKRMNEYLGIQMHPLQDFDKIEAAQLRKDAQKAEKAARKAAKNPVTVQEPEPAVIAPEPEPAVEAPKGGPNRWRENGWVSSEHPVSEPGVDYSMLGKDATEDDRRALFVLDSLASEAASKLIRNNRFKDEWPGRASLRHQGTNYDSKSRDFGMDVAWNARTGNLPKGGAALVLKTAVSGAGNRLTGQMTGVVDGKDLYDLLFRKKVDRRINELDNRYRVEF